MKTEELLNRLKKWDDKEEELYTNGALIVEIIKRLEELEELRGIIRNPHLTHDHTMDELIEIVTNIVKE